MSGREERKLHIWKWKKVESRGYNRGLVTAGI